MTVEYQFGHSMNLVRVWNMLNARGFIRVNTKLIGLAILLVLIVNGSAWALEKHTFQFQNEDRAYFLHNEMIGEVTQKPLVVVLHGWRKPDQGVHGEDKLDNQLYSTLDELAESEDFVTMYPTALRGQWNPFDLSDDKFLLESNERVDDVGYIRALIDDMVVRKIADPSRIYLTGFSDGAILTYRLLCQKDQPFAAGAPMMGTMHEDHRDNCSPDYVPSVLVFAGTHDRILSYYGWIYENTGREISIPETMEKWRNLHNCTGQKGKKLDDVVIDDNAHVIYRTWTGCDVDDAVQLYRIEGGGYQVPSRKPTNPRWIEKFGNRSQDIEASHEAWSFFKNFTR